jgi:two-component system, NarL family, sensor kinase
MTRKNWLLIVVLTVVFYGNGFTQTNKIIDSIEKRLPSQSDTILAMSYNELTWQYRTINKQKAIEYGNKALELGKKTGFSKAVAQAYNDMGIIYFDMQDFDKALEYYNNAFAIREKLKDTRGMASLYNKIGIIHQKAGRFDKALDNQLKALKLFEQVKDDRGISYSLNNIGIINQNMGNLDESLRYQEQSIAIKEKIKDRYGLAGSYVNVGNIYTLKNDLDKALEYFRKGEKISREIGDKEYLSNALNNLAALYEKRAAYAQALPFAEESYSIRHDMGDTKGEVSCLANLGAIHTKLKQYDAAEQKLNLALKIGDTLASCRPEKPKLYDALSKLYEAKGDFKKSLEMERLHRQWNDSLFTTDLNTKFSEMETKYQTEKKERVIEQQQFELTRKNYLIGGAIALLLLGGLLGYSYYTRYRLRQDARLQQEIMKQQDMATKAVIEAEENERKRIASDLHDGVGQMMSAAKMNLSAIETDLVFKEAAQQSAFNRVVDLIDESCREVRAVSHNMMPNALLKSGLASAVREFIEKIDSRVMKINLHSEGLDERLDNNVETVLYRVVQECVNNVIKHAAANHLDISLVKDADGISATIEDNGKGFDATDKSKFNGLGLKNIQTRIAYLKGTVDFDSAPGRGTLVAIHVPL